MFFQLNVSNIYNISVYFKVQNTILSINYVQILKIFISIFLITKTGNSDTDLRC